MVVLPAIELTFREPIFAAPGYREKLAALLAKHDEQMPGFAGIVESTWHLAGMQPTGGTDRVAEWLDAPWERARVDRLRRGLVATMLEEAKNGRFPPPGWDRHGPEVDRQRRSPAEVFWLRLEMQREMYAGGVELVRGLRLAVAASEFAVARGRPPHSLDELAPAILPRLPQSAYIGGAFRLIDAVSLERTRVIGYHRQNLRMALGQGVIVDDVAPFFFVVVPKSIDPGP